ncbi:LysR family transcriptional regulator [Litoribrevibacter albus]|uniref:LysR family transcriptional regulator n=1 Tax=Litoribrevibacter albus TaxID=1473156 RepID=A0AA37W742_9GAMM|nr:LysR family transcriptional regulator [Litoribrevibacter albus]GLQ30943.1 LysR family transcriptional regulator [Litoribrevibacter albus]
MDTQTLRAFLSVAKHQSFSEAAEELFLTQPAVSKRVSSLEERLETKLFDRVGRKVSLTPSGNALLPKAKQILHLIKSTEQELHNLSLQVSGSLEIICSHHIGLHRLPPILKEYSQRYPDVDLKIEFSESESGYEQVLHGDKEMALITLAPDPHPSLISKAIWHDQMHFVCSQDHPLAASPHLNLIDLASHKAILPSPNTFTRQKVEELFADTQVSLDVVTSTNYLDTIRMMVSIGYGWSVLPESLCENLHQLPITTQMSSRQLGYVVHKHHSLTNAAKALIEMLKADEK